MTEQILDANEELETSTDSSTVEDQQDSNVSEDAQNTESGKSFEVKYKEALAALRAERAKNKTLKQQPVQTQSEDVAYQAFLRTQADAYIAKKLAIEPNFRELAPLIEEKVAQGYDIYAAEIAVKAELFEKIAKESSSSELEDNKPKQLETTAIPEQTKPKSSGNILDDVSKGNVEGIPQEMIDAIKRIRG
jgi:hypothetical protein